MRFGFHIGGGSLSKCPLTWRIPMIQCLDGVICQVCRRPRLQRLASQACDNMSYAYQLLGSGVSRTVCSLATMELLHKAKPGLRLVFAHAADVRDFHL